MKDTESDYLKLPPTEPPDSKAAPEISDIKQISEDGRVTWTFNGEVSLCSFNNHPDNFPPGVRSGLNLNVSTGEKKVNQTGRRRRKP